MWVALDLVGKVDPMDPVEDQGPEVNLEIGVDQDLRELSEGGTAQNHTI